MTEHLPCNQCSPTVTPFTKTQASSGLISNSPKLALLFSILVFALSGIQHPQTIPQHSNTNIADAPPGAAIPRGTTTNKKMMPSTPKTTCRAKSRIFIKLGYSSEYRLVVFSGRKICGTHSSKLATSLISAHSNRNGESRKFNGAVDALPSICEGR